jgi:LacI family transcriptional regulator
MRYARAKPEWRIVTRHPDQGLDAVRDVHFDGVIAHVDSVAVAEIVKQLNAPIVNTSNRSAAVRLPRVGVDDVKLGEVAARHLRGAGYDNFAFVGYDGHYYADLRREGFSHALEREGFRVHVFPSDRWPDHMDEIPKWLGGLPRPLAVFTCNDLAGNLVIEACNRLGLRVPEQVGVLGTDNDQVTCSWSWPPLSSVRVPAQEIGYGAAELLDQILQGQPAPEKAVLLPPGEVARRESTDTVITSDRELAAALVYIRENVHRPIDVQDVIEAVPMSRRSLEGKFRSELGTTPAREIRRLRLEKVKALLCDSDLSVAEIAERTGFSSPEQLARVFRREEKTAPTEYRAQHRSRI